MLGLGGAPQSQGCSPSLLGRPKSGLELCRRDGSDCTHGYTRADVMGVPDASFMVSMDYDSEVRNVWKTRRLDEELASMFVFV